MVESSRYARLLGAAAGFGGRVEVEGDEGVVSVLVVLRLVADKVRRVDVVQSRAAVVDVVLFVVVDHLLDLERLARRELVRDLLERLVLRLGHEDVGEDEEADQQDDEDRKDVVASLTLHTHIQYAYRRDGRGSIFLHPTQPNPPVTQMQTPLL